MNDESSKIYLEESNTNEYILNMLKIGELNEDEVIDFINNKTVHYNFKKILRNLRWNITFNKIQKKIRIKY
jgi:hypothetical protein